MLKTRLRGSILAACFCLLGALGCGSGPAPVTLRGTIVLPANISLEDSDSGTISFMPATQANKSAAVTLSGKSLSFVSKSITPGKYTIVASFQPYPGKEGSQKRSDLFKPLNKGFDMKNSKLTLEVSTEPEQSIVINLDKGTVNKQ
jgi:hypothetical protein